MDLENKQLHELFELADKIGKQRYHKLTQQDFEDYRKFDQWRYINGDSECGTTQESRDWVKENSESHCPICGEKFSINNNGKTIDHKLPRSQYPWLSMDFRNLWVICRNCNQEKGEMHWFEYEHYLLIHYPDRLQEIQIFRPTQLLKSLKE
ncbi:MAG: HNH endonuclease [Alkalinema sp. CACIAM 70d]|nr:MAG: HNH endonuclease [Alkalinema sp. CACIAM 70d]